MPKPNSENKDFPQVIKESYDPSLERIRVDALISDGMDAMVVNSDGSINVNVVSGSVDTTDYKSYYNEVTSVASATQTTVLSYTVPVGKDAFIQKICFSGTNIAEYEVLVNATTQDKKRTYFGNSLDGTFVFDSSNTEGYPLQTGDVVEIKVLHNRPNVGDFNCRLQVVEV